MIHQSARLRNGGPAAVLIFSVKMDSSRRQILTGNLRTTVFSLALPVLLQQCLTFCVSFTDTYLSGRIDAEATTAIGLAAYVGWLASMLFGLVTVGTTALVARYWGAGEFERACRVTGCSLTLSVFAGIVCGVSCWLAARLFPEILGMDARSTDIAVRYLQIDSFGYLFTSITLAGAAALRGSGDMRTPTVILGLVSVLNVIISSLLVFGPGAIPRLGVDGIVLGTVSSRIVGGVLMVVVLVRGRSGVRVRPADLTLHPHVARRVLRIGIPAAIDGIIMWTGQFVFLRIIAELDHGNFASTIFAAHVVCVELEAITYLSAVAWGHAAATIIGQSLGAGDPQRAFRTGHESVRQCCIPGALVTAIFLFGSSGIYRLMHSDPAVVAIGASAFRMVALFQIPLLIGIIYVSALRGAGDSRSPMLITAVGVIGVRLPVAWICGVVLEGGLCGAWIGMCADMGLRGLLAYLWYQRSNWAEKQL